jgi:hypothetical protein
MSNPNRDITGLSIPEVIPAGQECLVPDVSAAAAQPHHDRIGTRLAASVPHCWPAADRPAPVSPIRGAAQHVRSAISGPPADIQSP